MFEDEGDRAFQVDGEADGCLHRTGTANERKKEACPSNHLQIYTIRTLAKAIVDYFTR